MDKMTLREAVKHFDVSRPTLQKALKTGKVSGVQDGQGHWQVDPSELARLYRPRGSEQVNEQAKLPTANSPELTALQAELELERTRRQAAETLAEERGKHLEDLRRLLPAPDARKRWWQR